MAQASPAKRSFNAGEFSILVEARTDIDKYPASMRSILNAIAAPQGPFLRRSGTYFTCEAYKSSKYSTLMPFIVNESDALNLEFTDARLRFVFETGLQTYPPVAVTSINAASPNLIITSALLAANVGDQVALDNFNSNYNLNTRVFNILAKSGNDYTLDVTGMFALSAVTGPTVARVYHIATPYTDVDVRNIRVLQDQDTVYLFCAGYQPRQLSRVSAYNWVLTLKQFNNGPFMDEDALRGTINLSATGRLLPTSSSASGGTAANAFDGDQSTLWDSGVSQTGILEADFSTAKVINGYVIYTGSTNTDPTYAAADYAPGTWTFEAWDGTNWLVLDEQKSYVLYDAGRSGWFQINNTTAYSKYRINVTQAKRNGTTAIRIAELVFSTPTPPDITVTINGSTSLNNNTGFVTTDVGRLMRMQSADGLYRIVQVKAYTSASVVTATLLTEPFIDLSKIMNWSVGYLSDTTGWPCVATFFDDRMWCSGIPTFPGLVISSRVGLYDDFLQKTSDDTVLDDGGLAVTVKSRKVSDVRWLETDERGLLIGTGDGQFVISAANTDGAITAKNIKGRASTSRGSASIEPAKVDRNIINIHVSRRTVREFSYTYQTDGYISRSLSLYASHLGVPQLAQIVYAAEPHSILWMRRDDGSVVGLTYNKEEDVVGWHRHDFSGIVESMSVIPSAADKQDSLYMVIKRTINGSDVRYIERLTRFWDFDSVIAEAHFVDSGLKYEGAATNVLYGLAHLEGKTLQGVFNGIPFDNIVVTNGMIETPIADVTTAVLGLGFETDGEISRMDAGAADGTAMGKKMRMQNVSPHIWDSFYGEIGRWNAEAKAFEYEDIVYSEPYDELTPITLQTEVLEPINLPPGYSNRGTLAFRQTKPLPFNIIGLYPQLNTMDR